LVDLPAARLDRSGKAALSDAFDLQNFYTPEMGR
jgi:hypothetical protein